MIQQVNILPDSRNKCFIAIGSNQPLEYIQPFELVQTAIKKLADEDLRIENVSRFYKTPAFPQGSGPDFINAAVAATTGLDAGDVIQALHKIEKSLGRDRRSRWAPRTLDMDLIDFAGQVLPDAKTYKLWADLALNQQQTEAPDQLILPHPRLRDRGFVLLPLRDVAPDWRHPVTGETVGALIDRLDPGDIAEMAPL